MEIKTIDQTNLFQDGEELLHYVLRYNVEDYKQDREKIKKGCRVICVTDYRIGIVHRKVNNVDKYKVEFENGFDEIESTNLIPFNMPSFNTGASVIIIAGEYKGLTGLVSKWRNDRFSFMDKHINPESKVFLDMPIATENDYRFFVTVKDFLLDYYNYKGKSYCCYRKGAQDELRERLLDYLDTTKTKQIQIAEELNIDYRAFNLFKNENDTVNIFGRKYKYLYPKPFYLLSKYLEDRGY